VCQLTFFLVTWTLLWLKLADHAQDINGELLGPLFGQLTEKGRTNLTMKNQSMRKAFQKDYMVKVGKSTSPDVANWGTEEGELVNLTDWHVGSILRSVIKGASKIASSRMEHDSAMKEAWRRLQRATPHSFRVGFVAWAGRAGGDGAYVQARLGGRWQITSDIFDLYWGRGETKRNKYRGSQDPIHKRLPWPKQGFTWRSNTTGWFEIRSLSRAAGHRASNARRREVERGQRADTGGRREGREGRREPGVAGVN